MNSPTKRCGKSRLLEILEQIVARPWYMLRPTEAILFRKIERDRPTLLIDEVDAIFTDKSGNTEGLRAVLNGGNRRGAKVPRCVGERMELVDFSIYAAKVLAGIGRALPETVRDRSIPIALVRKQRGEKRPMCGNDVEPRPSGKPSGENRRARGVLLRIDGRRARPGRLLGRPGVARGDCGRRRDA